MNYSHIILYGLGVYIISLLAVILAVRFMGRGKDSGTDLFCTFVPVVNSVAAIGVLVILICVPFWVLYNQISDRLPAFNKEDIADFVFGKRKG